MAVATVPGFKESSCASRNLGDWIPGELKPIGALYIHAVNVVQATSLLKSAKSCYLSCLSNQGKSSRFILLFPSTSSDPVIMEKWINCWNRFNLWSLCCSPAEQRHILPGHTSFPVQIPQSLLIIHFSIIDMSLTHKWEKFRGHESKGLPWKSLGSWSSAWGVLLDAIRLRGFSPHFWASWRVWGGDFHLLSCPAKAKKRCRTTTIEESRPPSNSMVLWSSCHGSELFLSYTDGK